MSLNQFDQHTYIYRYIDSYIHAHVRTYVHVAYMFIYSDNDEITQDGRKDSYIKLNCRDHYSRQEILHTALSGAFTL